MRRYSGGLVSRRSRGAVAPAAALAAAAWLAVAAAPAGATISPGTHDTAAIASGAQAAAGADASPPVGRPGRVLRCPRRPGNPVGTGDAASALVPFPRDGAAFLVLSTGDATQADDPDRPGVFPRRRRRRPRRALGARMPAPRRHATSRRVANPASSPGRSAARDVPLVRLALPLGGVPRAARQRLQRRLRRRDRQHRLDDVGLRRSRRRTTSPRCRTASR